MMEKIRSKDGVLLALRRIGAGQPLVLVHGTGGSSARWTTILPALEANFSICAMDRRGRGESGDAPIYAIEREFEDVAVVVNSIGQASDLLGHSYGAICSLEAALFTPQLRRLVLYEPPIPVEGVPIYSPGIIEHLESLSAAGHHGKVLTTFLKEVVRMPPHELEIIQKSSAWQARVAVAHTLPREMRAHERYRFKPERFKNFNVPTLLLLGGDSPVFFKAAIDALKGALPKSRVVILAGQQHIAMETAPELFVREVLSFLKG
jgi:pimeloyl-ACP methyl ester carboxylesterase